MLELVWLSNPQSKLGCNLLTPIMQTLPVILRDPIPSSGYLRIVLDSKGNWD